MAKKVCALVCAALLCCGVLAGCGGEGTSEKEASVPGHRNRTHPCLLSMKWHILFFTLLCTWLLKKDTLRRKALI